MAEIVLKKPTLQFSADAFCAFLFRKVISEEMVLRESVDESSNLYKKCEETKEIRRLLHFV